MKVAKAFTDKSIRSLACPPGKDRVYVSDPGCPNLTIMITAKGSKSWVWRGRIGTEKNVTNLRLGALEVYDLEHAHSWAKACTKAAKAGINLKQKKAEEAKAKAAEDQKASADAKLTLRWYWEELYLPRWIPNTRNPRTNKINETYRLLTKHLIGALGDRAMASITHRDLDKAVKDMAKGAPRSGDRFVVNVKTLFSRARQHHRYETALESNPALELAKVDGRIVQRRRFLEPEEIVYFYRAQLRLTGAARVYADLLSLLLDVGGRVTEARLVEFKDFNFDAGHWMLTDTKNGLDHKMPLPVEVLERVQARRTRDDQRFVFESTKRARSGAVWGAFNSQSVQMPVILEKMREIAKVDGVLIAGWSAHALRRTFNTLLKRKSRNQPVPGLTKDGIERAINHAKSKDMEDWYDADLYEQDKMIAYREWQTMLAVCRKEAEAAEAKVKASSASWLQ